MIALAAIVTSACREDLASPVAWSDACAELNSAINAKCEEGGVDVCGDPATLTLCSDPIDVEEDDLDACLARIDSASNCMVAATVECEMDCIE